MHKTCFQILGSEHKYAVNSAVHIPRKGEIVILDKTKYKVYEIEYEFESSWHDITNIIIEKV